MKLIPIPDDQSMRAFGQILGKMLPKSLVVYLRGELGAGKTTLVRGLLRGLGYSGAVKSPTYTLVEEYELAHRHIYHLDLYRLADPEELEFLGLRDWLEEEAVLIFEWPQMGRGVAPLADLDIEIRYDGTARNVMVTGCTQAGELLALALQPKKEP